MLTAAKLSVIGAGVAAIVAAGLTATHAVGAKADAEPVTPVELIDGIPADLFAEMRKSTCGGFAEAGPADPYAIEGYRTPIRAVD